MNSRRGIAYVYKCGFYYHTFDMKPILLINVTRESVSHPFYKPFSFKSDTCLELREHFHMSL